jgi:hypothetical protein
MGRASIRRTQRAFLPAAAVTAPLTDQHAAYIDDCRRAISIDQRLITTAAQRAERQAYSPTKALVVS